jgi:hypothetical protein
MHGGIGDMHPMIENWSDWRDGRLNAGFGKILTRYRLGNSGSNAVEYPAFADSNSAIHP